MIINHNNLVISDEVVHLLMPVAKVIQQVGNDLQGLTAMGRRWMGWNEQQDAHQALAAQQELLDRAGHLGQLVGLVTMGLVALRAGRLWEVHQVCQATLQQPAGWKGWAHQMAGTQPFMHGLTYLNCCSQQLGLYAAGMFLLYLLMRLSWSGTGQRSGLRGRPSQAFQLDLLVVKAGLCSWLGAHVVHCLGGAWLPWLVGWLAWCGVQLWLNVRVVASLHSSVAIVLVALVMPLVNAIGPFRPNAVALQGWAVEVFPVLAWAPSLGHLLPGNWW